MSTAARVIVTQEEGMQTNKSDGMLPAGVTAPTKRAIANFDTASRPHHDPESDAQVHGAAMATTDSASTVKEEDHSFDDSGIVADSRAGRISIEGNEGHGDVRDNKSMAAEDVNKNADEAEVRGNVEEEEEDEDEEYEDEYGELDDFKDEIGSRLDSAFRGKNNHAAFAATGLLPDAPNPGLDITGLGQVGLPLTPSDAQRIVAISEQAPFGKQEQTIVDVSVRRTWQLDAAKVKFNNPAWLMYLQNLVFAQVGLQLGIGPSSIIAHLYKLLLYAPGGHFEKHQDTEKEPGMFATLIVVLPSLFSGGQVSLSHLSKELVFDSAGNSAFGTSFASWYTDVYHKVHPVTSGFRLALSFNLMLKDTVGAIPRAPVPDNSMLRLREMFAAWIDREDAGWDTPDYIGHILDHKYSKVGLGFGNMKGQDRPKVAFLKDIASELGFSIYLAQLDITITGSGSNMFGGFGGYGYSRGYRKRCYYDDSDEDDYGDDDDDDDTMDEETERDISLKNAVGVDGIELDLSHFEFLEEDLVPTFDTDRFSYDDKDSEGYQGNYGGDVNHYYHKTIVLLWRQESDFRMRVRGGGSANVMKSVRQKTTAYLTSPNPQLRQDIVDFSLALALEGTGISDIARAALAINSIDLFSRIGDSQFHRIEAAIWPEVAGKFGLPFVRETLDKVCNGPALAAFVDAPKTLCSVILAMQAAFTSDDSLVAWGDLRLLDLLTAVQKLDEDIVKYATRIVSRQGFDKCRTILTALIGKAPSAAPPPLYHTQNSNVSEKVAFSLLDDLRKLPTDKLGEQATAWADEQEMRLLGRAKLEAAGMADRLVQVARRVGFTRCRELLVALLTAHGNPVPALAYGYSAAPIRHPLIVPRLLEDLRKVFVSDKLGMEWLDERLLHELSASAAVDEQAVKIALDVAKRVGFAKARPMLDSMCKTLSKPSQYGRPSSTFTAVELAVMFLDEFVKIEQWVTWCTGTLTAFLLPCKALSPDRCSTLVRAVENLMQLPPAVVSQFLSGFRRASYTVSHLVDVVQPFAKALCTALEKKHTTFTAPGLCQFATYFGKAALKVIRKPEPLQPGDFSLTPIGDSMVDSFLASPIQHVHKVQAVQGVRTGIERRLGTLLRLGKVQLETMRYGSPHTLVIRKTRPTPCSGEELKKVLTTAKQPAWREAIRTCNSAACPHCQAISNCLEWIKAEAQLTEFWSAFGKGVLNSVMNAPRAVPAAQVVQPVLGQPAAVGGNSVDGRAKQILSERPSGAAAPGTTASVAESKAVGTSSVAGQKRKPLQTIAFIDLTESPPKKKAKQG